MVSPISSLSSGYRLRRSMTSTSTPSPASLSAASSASYTCLPYVMMERSEPGLATRPLPRGMGSRLVTSPLTPKSVFCSKYITGSSSSMAASMRPRASCAQEG